MSALLVLAALVVALYALSRVLPPITDSDGRDVENGRVRAESRTTPLPHSTPVATGWRAWLSRHVVSRHETGSGAGDGEWPDAEDAERVGGGVVEWASGVHVDRPSLDDWLLARLDQTPNRARLAKAAASEYRCSLRTAQRAIARLTSRSTR